MELLTFGLATAAYASLALDVCLGGRRGVSIATAVLALTHVFLVWHLRFEWSIAMATTRGWGGFVVFHAALGLIVAAAAAPAGWARRLVFTAFPIVSIGTVSAVFRYEFVAVWRWPVIAIAAAGLAGLVFRARRSTRP